MKKIVKIGGALIAAAFTGLTVGVGLGMEAGRQQLLDEIRKADSHGA